MVGQRGLAQKEGCGSAGLGKRGRKELVQSQVWVPGTKGKQVFGAANKLVLDTGNPVAWGLSRTRCLGGY